MNRSKKHIIILIILIFATASLYSQGKKDEYLSHYNNKNYKKIKMIKGAKFYRVIKKYLFIYVIGALLIVSCAKKEYGPANVNKIRLSWTDDPTTTMTIGWDQLDGKNSTIYYGTEDHDRNWEDYQDSAKPTRELEHLTMNTRFCDLKKLIPNEEYYFVIKDSSGVSERLWSSIPQSR